VADVHNVLDGLSNLWKDSDSSELIMSVSNDQLSDGLTGVLLSLLAESTWVIVDDGLP